MAWKKLRPKNFSKGDVANQALSSANVSLYGVVFSVGGGIGLIPAGWASSIQDTTGRLCMILQIYTRWNSPCQLL